MNAATLLNAGYRIENARIISADLTMEDHGCLTLYMTLEGSGFGCVYGGYCLGHGYLGAGHHGYYLEFCQRPGARRYHKYRHPRARFIRGGQGIYSLVTRRGL